MPRPLVLAALLLAGAAPDTPMLRAFRARDWPAATHLAQRSPDPLAVTLVTFIRLITPGEASAGDIDAFLAAHPDWPDRALLLRRREEAILAEPDPLAARALCAARPPSGAPALARCAAAYADTGDAPAAAGAARAAWPGLSPAAAPSFLARWSASLRPEDDWARFDRLDWAGDAAAAAALPRLDAPHAALARARLACREGAPGAAALRDAVPPALHADPTLFLACAKAIRRAGALTDAAAQWRQSGATAEQAAPAPRRAAFWSERDALARALLEAGRTADAAGIAEDPAAAPEQRAESLFLAGWIALRAAHDPSAARTHFAALAAMAHSVQTLSRANYWLGRAAEEANDTAASRAAYARAAAYPVTFYGQRAAAALGRTPALPPDPPASATATLAFSARAPIRAAILLHDWNDPRRARDFLIAAAQSLRDPADVALAAAEANALALPDTAVRIARMAGHEGIMLPGAGWPMPVAPPDGAVPRPLALGLIRQESSFDSAIISAAGAVGLMQLTPATAAGLAHGAPDLADPATNLQLGTRYLAALLKTFAGNPALALAAYDAGPHRVAAWREASGTPEGERATIDWIERIPFAETRGYVQRVLENAAVYAAKLNVRFEPFGA